MKLPSPDKLQVVANPYYTCKEITSPHYWGGLMPEDTEKRFRVNFF